LCSRLSPLHPPRTSRKVQRDDTCVPCRCYGARATLAPPRRSAVARHLPSRVRPPCRRGRRPLVRYPGAARRSTRSCDAVADAIIAFVRPTPGSPRRTSQENSRRISF
jgi:hypothetical protein